MKLYENLEFNDTIQVKYTLYSETLQNIMLGTVIRYYKNMTK
jgi:hypothetical protein